MRENRDERDVEEHRKIESPFHFLLFPLFFDIEVYVFRRGDSGEQQKTDCVEFFLEENNFNRKNIAATNIISYHCNSSPRKYQKGCTYLLRVLLLHYLHFCALSVMLSPLCSLLYALSLSL